MGVIVARFALTSRQPVILNNQQFSQCLRALMATYRALDNTLKTILYSIIRCAHTQDSKDIYARCDVIKVISKAPNNNL
jgi:hypothetical protein